MPEKIRPIEQMLELSEEEPLSPEHLDNQVQRAQEQLLQLKRQQDQIEKQKRELEPVFSSGGRSILEWMKIGFAFSLPLIVFGFIALFLFFWMASTGR